MCNERGHTSAGIGQRTPSVDEDQPYRPQHPIHMLVGWSERVGRPLKLNFHGEDEEDIEAGLYIATWFCERTERI